jgi:hypothetical protein
VRIAEGGYVRGGSATAVSGSMRRCLLRALLLVVALAAPAAADVHVDVVVGVDPAGKLVAKAETTSFALPPSRVVGLAGYAGTVVGFRSVDPSAATDDFRALDSGAHLAFEVLYTDPGLVVIDEAVGAPVRRGDLLKLGVAPLDAHPLWSLAPDVRGPRKTRIRLLDRARIHDPAPMMTLTFTPDPKAEAWLCPMRCEGATAYDAPEPCPRCGTPLSLATVASYEVEIDSVPRSLRAETPVRLGITLRDPSGGPVTVDADAIDAYVVSADLASFAHGRPVRNPDGTFHLPATFPASGLYTVFLEFAAGRVGVQHAATDVVVAGSPHDRERLDPNEGSVATVDGYTVTLETDGPLVPLHEIGCRFAVARAGAPVRQLSPVRGAPGQLVIVGENRTWFLHRIARPGGAPDGAAFRCVFPKPGTYRMWLQLQPGAELLTVPFTVRVVRADAVRSRRSTADDEGVHDAAIEGGGGEDGGGGDGGDGGGGGE